MNKVFTTALCFALVSFLVAGSMGHAQSIVLQDNFETGTLTGWTEGTPGDWTVSGTGPLNGSFSLKHNLSGVTDESFITHALTVDPTLGNMTWEWQWLNGAWDPSSLNRYWFYLMSDQQNIGGATQNGYAVGVNITGTTDEIFLARITAGAHDATVINAGPGFAVDASDIYGFRVTRTSGGDWELFIDQTGGFDNLVSAGTGTDNVYATANPWCGFFFDFTTSRAGELWIDDVTIETTQGVTPQIDLTVAEDSIREGEFVDVTVTASTPVSAAKTFTLTTSGTATGGTDYSAIPATITIPMNSAQATIRLNTLTDIDWEGPETIGLQLGSNGQTGITMGDSTAEVLVEEYVRVMDYNLLRYPSATNIADKDSNLLKIIEYLDPDILGVNELDASGGIANANNILNNVLNMAGGITYQGAAYLNTSGSSISNMLYYNSEKFGLKTQGEIFVTGQRNADYYTLYYDYPDLSSTGDSIFLHVILTHLKAGSFPSDSLDRIAASNAIMTYMDANGPGNFLLMGDFNIKTDQEESYQNFIDHTNAAVNFYDPINTPGDWNSNPAFAHTHTQSTRDAVIGDGGASGGMDDRFDFILASGSIMNGTDSITYIPRTYSAVGQDGLRLNASINSPANTIVSSELADALLAFSDHLPVVTGLRFNYPGAIITASGSGLEDAFRVQSFPNPVDNRLTVKWTGSHGSGELTLIDLAGRVVLRKQMNDLTQITMNTSDLAEGLYLLRVASARHSIIKKVVVLHP